MQRAAFCLVLLTAGLLGFCARAQIVPVSTPLNNLITERVYDLQPPRLKNLSSDTNASAAMPFITASDVSLEFDYIYARQWFQMTTPGGGYTAPEMITKINGYNTVPSVLFVIRSNLLVTAGFDYLHEDISTIGSTTSQTFDDYTPFVYADEELLHFLPRVDTTRNSLLLGGNFSYTRSVSSVDAPGAATGLGYNDYVFGPSLVYIRSLVDWPDGAPGRVSFTLNPAYTYYYYQTPLGLERSGNFSLLGRMDAGLTRNVYLDISATWVHNIYAEHAGPDRDWAFFGAGLTAKLLNQSNHLLLFRLAYSYEAFLTRAEIHEISAQVEYHF
ncbi:MAG TPA: hypothetical protein VK742_08415 [Candidatus Sulfotelmatobacter sp.]|jgi:hypothetical protein|nr:hypothetical protein [Candidatus Sulfotelmatobacter sp.]